MATEVTYRVHEAIPRLLLWLFLLTLSISGVVMQSTIASAAPERMNFQGRLLNASGTIVPDGHYNMQFKIYDAASGGTSLWGETREDTSRVQVTNGLFSVQLGEVSPLSSSVFDSDTRYFEITMATPGTATCATTGCATWESPMAPRNQLATSAYAFNAAKAQDSDTLDGLDSTDFAAASGSNNYIQNSTSPQSADFNVMGSGHVGTRLTVLDAPHNNPDARLQVYTGSGTSKGIVVQRVPASNQTANLLEFQHDTGAVLAAFDANANLLLNGTNKIGFAGSPLNHYIQGQGGVGMTIRTVNTLLLHAPTTNLTGNVTVAAEKSITMVGGATSTRPASPTEGMMYFDTTTDQLLTYANGKWQGDRSTSTKIVAASNSSQSAKDAADYISDGMSDQVEINSALAAASGGKVYLMKGTYTADATIQIPNNTTLQGTGHDTEIRLADIDVNDNLIENADTIAGTGIVVRDLKLNGQKNLNTGSITQNGIFLDGMGGGAGSATRKGADIRNLAINAFRSGGLHIAASSSYNKVESLSLKSNYHGLVVAGHHNTLTGNNVHDSFYNAYITGTKNTFSGSVFKNSIHSNFHIPEGGNNNTITGNVMSDAALQGIYLHKAHENIISSNIITGSGHSGANISWSNKTIITGNQIIGSGKWGIIHGQHSSGAVISNNRIQENVAGGIGFDYSSYTAVKGNSLMDNGTADKNDAIVISNSSYNQISGNTIRDTEGCITTCTAIKISSGDENVLSANTIHTGHIDDLGTGTLLNGQIDDTGKLLIRTTGGFAAQSAAGTDILMVDGNSNAIYLQGLTSIGSIGISDNNAVLCRNSSNEFAECNDTFVTGSSSDYIQNTTTPQPANIAVHSAAAGNVGAVIQGAASQTADLLQLQDSTGEVLARVDSKGRQYAGGFYITSRFDGNPTGGVFALNASASGYVNLLKYNHNSNTVVLGGDGSRLSYSGSAASISATNGDGVTIGSPSGSLALKGYTSGAPLLSLTGNSSAQTTFRIQGASNQSANLLQIKGVGGVDSLTISSNGHSIFRNSTDSTSAFKILNAGGVELLSANSSDSRIVVGSATADADAVLFVVDHYNQATDPTGVNGASYYNTSLNKMRCYEGGEWKDCIGPASGGSDSKNITLVTDQFSTSGSYSSYDLSYHQLADLSSMSEYRMTAQWTNLATCGSGGQLYATLRYSTDGGASWANDTSAMQITATGIHNSAWKSMPVNAQNGSTLVSLNLMCDIGLIGGGTSVSIKNVGFEFRQ